MSEQFLNYFYDHCCAELFKPLLELPDLTPEASESALRHSRHRRVAPRDPARRGRLADTPADPAFRLDRRQTAITHHLVELLYFCVMLHTQRSSFYVLSNPINKKVVSLLYLRDKPLRLGACLPPFEGCSLQEDPQRKSKS